MRLAAVEAALLHEAHERGCRFLPFMFSRKTVTEHSIGTILRIGQAPAAWNLRLTTATINVRLEKPLTKSTSENRDTSSKTPLEKKQASIALYPVAALRQTKTVHLTMLAWHSLLVERENPLAIACNQLSTGTCRPRSSARTGSCSASGPDARWEARSRPVEIQMLLLCGRSFRTGSHEA